SKISSISFTVSVVLSSFVPFSSSTSIVKNPSSVAGRKLTPVVATPAPPIANKTVTIKIVINRWLSTQLTERSINLMDDEFCLFTSKFGSGVVNILLANIGTTVNATNNEAIKLNAIANANSVKIFPTMPLINTIGRNTTIVVNVDAEIAQPTTFVPAAAASLGHFAIPRCIEIFSITTIELSTNLPIPNARPPSVIIFKLTSVKYRNANVTMTENGIEIPIISGVFKFLKKKNN